MTMLNVIEIGSNKIPAIKIIFKLQSVVPNFFSCLKFAILVLNNEPKVLEVS